jgi:RNA-binding protein
MTLSEPQKKYLRGLGHNLKPLIMIGEAGLTEAVGAEFEATLTHHELVKIRVRVGDRKLRDAIVADIAKNANAEVVQRVGNIALLFRPNPAKKDPLVIPGR